MPKAEVKKAAVLGWPVNHSLSPRLHNYWLKQYNIEGSYEALAVESQHLKQTLHDLADKGFVGVNLTVPHKEQALDYMNDRDENAQRIGAVNTVMMHDGKLLGKNTDAYGFTKNLESQDVTLKGKKTLVIGAGGAARAVARGILAAGAILIVANRSRDKADRLVQDMGGGKVINLSACESAMEGISLLVNTTSLGMKGQPPLDLNIDKLPRDAVVTDIVYNPLETPLLAAAKARGNPIVDGLGMLLYQAQPAFEAFFGVRPEVTPALREHVLKGLL